jgi:hypothetical protein
MFSRFALLAGSRVISSSKTGFPRPVMRHGAAQLQAESTILKTFPSAWKRLCKKKRWRRQTIKLDGIIFGDIVALS